MKTNCVNQETGFSPVICLPEDKGEFNIDVSVIITLLNDIECLLNKKKIAAPCDYIANQMHPLVREHSETPFIQKIESEYIARLVPHKTHYYHGSHLGIWGERPIELNRERLQERKRSHC